MSLFGVPLKLRSMKLCLQGHRKNSLWKLVVIPQTRIKKVAMIRLLQKIPVKPHPTMTVVAMTIQMVMATTIRTKRMMIRRRKRKMIKRAKRGRKMRRKRRRRRRRMIKRTKRTMTGKTKMTTRMKKRTMARV